MAKYVDGFVIPIPKKNLAAYRKMAKLGSRLWCEHGAVGYFECVGDDLKTKGMLPFPKLAGTKAGETVVFSWIVFKSKAHRDSVNAKVMADKRMAPMMKGKMPFDVKRTAYGGFKVLVEG
jgi:uncharacterized protein YbaA (DUF1428 family)